LALFKDHCAACHETRDGNDRQIVGPSLDNIAEQADDRVNGMSAEEYLRQSILEPDAHLVDGFQPGTMQQNFAVLLSDEEVDHLVAYLMTLD
jgi:mono/diheme cytochrome c family protein